MKSIWMAMAFAAVCGAQNQTGNSGAAAEPGVVRLDVDASDAPTRLLHVRMQIPARPGPLTLLYPKWIPGEHGPTGPIEDFVGMKISAGGQPVAWQRDNVNMFAFHVSVPPGANSIDIAAEFISPPETNGFSSGSSITSQLAVLSWNQFLLYPEGGTSDSLQFKATLKVPATWRYGTALPIESESGNSIVFKPSSLTTLVDSPVQTGAYFRTVDLSPAGPVPTYLHIAADSERATRISGEQTTHYMNLVREAQSLFGGHHYRDYHFLFTLSDHVAHFGLEHHESSDDRVEEDSLVDPDAYRLANGLLTHEYVHSWNGKFRRPAGLATGDYSQPMKGDLLWVYEGLTEYLGEILAPRTDLMTKQDFLDRLAEEAARLDKEEGRAWRPLEDTAVAAQLLYGARPDYADFRRGVDYYEEGTLIWLDADVLIRRLSKGAKSLDDFCRLWSGPSSGPEVKPYTFDDVVHTLNSVQAYDWAKFLNDRLKSTVKRAPLDGIEGGGYKLVFQQERSDYQKTREDVRKYADLSYSIGLVVKEAGEIADVHLNSPASRAGIPPNGRIVAVNGREFHLSLLRHTVKDSQALTLLVKDGEYYRTFSLDYHEGERYPHLVRDSARPDLISEIVRAHAH